MPLSHDVEGPASVTESRLLIGARAISNGLADRHLEGEFAATFLVIGTPPGDLSSCMVDCAEDLSTSHYNSDIAVSEFNVATRELRLTGLALASDYEELLRTLQYTNRATSPNVDTFTISVSDGGYNTQLNLPVSIRRRRRRSAVEVNPDIPLPTSEHIEDKSVIEEAKTAKRSLKLPSYVEEDQAEVTHGFSMWSLPAIIVSVSVLFAAAVIWAYQKKKAGSRDVSEA